MDSVPHAIADLQSPVHDALLSCFGREIVEGSSHFIGFQWPGTTKIWVVSYHARERQVLDECSLPVGRGRMFVLAATETGVVASPMSDLVRARLSYLLAHIGWSGVEDASRLYMQHQILLGTGASALLAAAQPIHLALAIQPDNAWASGRLGETYRRIANGWPGYGDTLFDPEPRVTNYVLALLYYQRSIDLEPDAPGAFWVHAHLGAAIVNVRAFAGVVHKPQSPALDALLDAWFPGSAPDEAYRLLTRKGQGSLILAQRRAGNYYPWAQDYYGATLTFAGFDVTEQDLAVDAFALALFNVVAATHLQPSMAKFEFEPGELYVNDFLQYGLLAFWLRMPIRAWALTRNGMGRMFQFDFLPGVQALQGFQLLVDISAGITAHELPFVPNERLIALLNSEIGADFSVGGVAIPEVPIVDTTALIGFIDEVVVRVGRPTIAPAMSSVAPLDTNIEMSLIQAYFVFKDFESILERLGGDTTQVSMCMGRIADRLGFEALGEGWDPTVDSRHELLGVMMSGKPTHKMTTHIRPRSP
ncbi:hypothetical protein [Paraliomyxa miuraensis]|uniref:hypothetical protein n=1 Tax=Paraliomyxa miuraensis TaxID=376150 RepID=UPI00224C7DF6|nr:hypothetical protein [Paraliomyxa miuraensis]MCX4243972.1 hypothetical protein [Paraliomyxa miuraensis]